MRNLKRVFAVIITVAMLASLMVPALASVSYLEEAKKLQTIGLFAGTEADLKLDEDVTRIQGLTFAIRAAGKEDEALAMTDEEVEELLAKFNDADDIPFWNGNGPKYVAYAIKNGITVGDGQGNFLPLAKISGRAFLVFLLKSGMGYADVTTQTAPDVAVEAGVLTSGQAVKYALAEDGIIRDDAAAILYGAAMNGVNADGVKFIEALIDAGFVSAEKAAEAGFITIAPEVLEAKVEAKNLKEVVLTFNKDVEDIDGIDKKESYKFKNLAVDSVAVDGNVVTLTVGTKEKGADNQASYKLTISKDILKDNNEFDVYFFDASMPEVVGITVTGPKSFELKFSEPIKDDGNLTLKSGTSTLSIDTSSLNDGKGSDTFNVKMYSTFTDGRTYTL
ncbi:MAG: S-layer homology domain-containing protein, partial [Clostridiaceae bacterium]|nr:S-layer homology domain-containing protein [Clostridiaceae bacterium]